MEPGTVVLKFNPDRWAEINANEQSDPQSRIVSFSYTKSDSNRHQSPSSAASQGPRKRHLRPLSSDSFERPVHDSLRNLAQYALTVETGAKSRAQADADWYDDLANVGQRLRFLRDTFKVLQSVRKRKMMGERADFRTLYDARASRMGSPQLLDEDLRVAPLSDDENAPSWAAMPAPSVSRRGRPRKRRGRDRKAPLGRADATVKRTRASRRVLEPPLPAPDRKPSPPPTTVGPRRRGRPRIIPIRSPLPLEEPQGPPLAHLPPILPSQRLSLVQGIPPYRHTMAGGAHTGPGTPELLSTSEPKSLASAGQGLRDASRHLSSIRSDIASTTQAHSNTSQLSPDAVPATSAVSKQSIGSQPFLPSQTAYSAPQHGSNPGNPSGYLPSQLLVQGVVPFHFQHFPPPAQSVPKRDLASQTNYSFNYLQPLNFAHFTEAAYAPTLRKPDASWGNKPSTGMLCTSGITKSQFPVCEQTAQYYKALASNANMGVQATTNYNPTRSQGIVGHQASLHYKQAAPQDNVGLRATPAYNPTTSQAPMGQPSALLYNTVISSANNSNSEGSPSTLLQSTLKPKHPANSAKKEGENTLPLTKPVQSQTSETTPANRYSIAIQEQPSQSQPLRLTYAQSPTIQDSASRSHLHYHPVPGQQPSALNYLGTHHPPNIQRGPIYLHSSTQAPSSMSLYNPWPVTYPEPIQLTESLGMALPSLKALENDIKLPRPPYFGNNHGNDHER